MTIFHATFDFINSHGAERIVSGDVYLEAENEESARELVRRDLYRLMGNYYDVAIETPGGAIGPFGVYRIQMREHPQAAIEPETKEGVEGRHAEQ